MEMHQIRYFLAVCSERNFTRAANLCQVSQPSLTRAIGLLEAELGGSLFWREHNSSRLTELGQIVKPRLQRVWDRGCAATAHALDFCATYRPKLKIGVLSTIAPTQLADLIVRMRVRHKEIELEIVDSSSAQELQERLIARELDAAIYGRPDKTTDTRLDRIPLFQERMMIVLVQSHRLTSRAAVRVVDLVGEPFVRRARCEYGELVARLLRQRGSGCEIALEGARDDWVLAMIARGLGVGLLPQHSVADPDLAARPLEEPALCREVGLYTSRQAPCNEGLNVFIQETVQLFDGHSKDFKAGL